MQRSVAGAGLTRGRFRGCDRWGSLPPVSPPLALGHAPKPYPAAPGFVPLVSLVELVWVLASCYDLTREQVGQALEALLRAKEIVLDRAEEVSQALRIFGASSADFADCLMERTAAAAGCERTMTFDAGAAKAAGMTLIT